MSEKLQDETKYLSDGEQWLSKGWWRNTFEIFFWFWVVGGIFHFVIFDPGVFPKWAVGLLILIPLRIILIKKGLL